MRQIENSGPVAVVANMLSCASTSGELPVAQSSEVAVAVMGATGSGKTSFINQISGSTLRVGSGLHSCTNEIQLAQSFQLEGRSVTLIDTPGFDDTTKSDTDILRTIAAFLATAYEKDKKLAGVIYIQRISDIRMSGISTRNFRMFRQLCGDDTLKNVVLVTNMWGEVSEEVGVARETELSQDALFFKPALEKGARLLRHYNTPESAKNILKYIISNQPEPLWIQRELIDDKKDISQTAAGEVLNQELRQLAEKHREDMKNLEEEMNEAMAEKDLQVRDELEVERSKLQAEMKKVEENSQKLASDYSTERADFERKFQDLRRELAELRQSQNHGSGCIVQ